MRRLPTLATLASILTATSMAACAPVTDTSAGTGEARAEARCFRTDSVRNFRTEGSTNLYIRSLRDDVFHINTGGGCWDLDSATSIAVLPTGGGSDTVCVGDPVRILVPGASPGHGACRAMVTKSLNAEEVAALPDRVRP
jgi:hypothetical protein